MTKKIDSLNKATLKDVARAAGVAWSTASYALNNGPKPVSASARKRVLDAAERLGYSSNLLARGLVTGRMRTIGILAPDLHATNTIPQIAGAEAQAQEFDYRLILATHLSEPIRAEIMQRDLSARGMAGIVSITASANADRIITEQLHSLDLPLIHTYHAPLSGLPGDYAVVDQAQGGYIATRRLLEMGRRRLAFIGPATSRKSAAERLDGFRRAHQEAGIAFSDVRIGEAEVFGTMAGRKATNALIQSGAPHPDGIVAASDTIAAGVLRVLAEAHLRVPDDVAVIGFDDIDIFCEGLNPTLSSVHVPLYEMGAWSVRRLIDRLENPEDWTPTTIYFDCTLTLRESA